MGFIGMATTSRVTAQGQIQVENVVFNANSHTATLYVRNVGATTVTTDAIYVTDNTAGTTLTAATGVSKSISQGVMSDIQYTADTFTSGHSYTFKVVCTDGTTAVYTTRW
jgi:hypothetical protein